MIDTNILLEGWNQVAFRKPPKNVLVDLLFRNGETCIGYMADEHLWFTETRKVLKDEPIGWRKK